MTAYRRPTAVNWNRCSNCHAVRSPQHLIHISHVMPWRKRGWICDPGSIHKDDPDQPCYVAREWWRKKGQ